MLSDATDHSGGRRSTKAGHPFSCIGLVRGPEEALLGSHHF